MPPARRSLLRGLALGLSVLAALGAASCTNTIYVEGCDEGEEKCDDECVDTSVDGNNCGACGEICLESACVDGECTIPCTSSNCFCPLALELCGDVCVDLLTDAAHCGACNAPCDGASSCVDGACVPDCACGQCDVPDLPSGEATVSGTTIGADASHEPSCVSLSGGDVAYRFVAPTSDTWSFDTVGTSFDTVLAVLSGCEEVACNDDDDFGTTSRVTVDLGEGTEVLVIVDTYSSGSEGPFSLRVSRGDSCGELTSCNGACVDTFSDPFHCGGCFVACGFDESCLGGFCECTGPSCQGCDEPVCGSCGAIVDLGSDLPVEVFGSTAGQLSELEPACVGGGSPEVVHRFRVPFSGLYTIDTDGSSFDTVLSILDAASCQEIGCNDDFRDLDSRVDLELFRGQEILVVVDGLGASGDYRMRISEGFDVPPPDARVRR